MPNYTDHDSVLKLLSDAQAADQDMRDLARKSNYFIDKADGQWDPSVIRQMDDRPRFTFDMISDLVDSIAGDMDDSDFDIKIRPAGGDATVETAKIYDGLIRNIENISNATDTYSSAGRSMVTCGQDGWRVTTEFVQSDAFDQDLIIRKIANYLDRVWFDTASELQDRSDSRYAFQLQSMPTADYDEQFPDGSNQSVSEGREDNVYFDKAEVVIVGEILYKKKTKTKLFQMTNGSVYTEESIKSVLDELAESGITVKRERTKDIDVVYSRFFDGGGWLGEEKETVFEWIPIIPTIANFKIVENKIIWHGVVMKKMDAQRVYNYAKSREIEEGALAPRGKYWGSEEQFAGHEDSLETMNTNAESVQTYNHQEGQPPPFWQGGAQINAGLQVTAADAKADIQTGGGQLNPALTGGMFQSGEAVKQLQGKVDVSNIKYYKPVKIAICHTARILMNAIPKVYDAQRQSRVLHEDGSFEIVTLNDQVFDQETQKMITLNDLTQGVYDATCEVAPAYKNRQQETIDTMLKIAGVAPGIMELGMDVFLQSSDSPKMEVLAERVRESMIQQGRIPESQLTDDEKAKLEEQRAIAAQQPSEPTPEEKIGEAELGKARATIADTESKIADRDKRFELDRAKLELNADEVEDKQQLEAIKVEQTEEMNLLKMQQQQFDQQQQTQEAIIKALSAQATTLKTLTDAVSNLAGPHTLDAAVHQAGIVTESQQDFEQPEDLEHSTSLSDNENLQINSICDIIYRLYVTDSRRTTKDINNE